MAETQARPIPTSSTGPQTGRARSGSIDATTLATSPTLSASQRFAALSLSPPTTLESDSFRQAVEHARSLSISAGTNGSGSEGTSEPDDPLVTPPSTSPRTGHAAVVMDKRGSLGNSNGLAIIDNDGDDDQETENEDMDALWAKGARWGFPTGAGPHPSMHTRRGSMGAPPSMAPLTRVASAGAPAKAAPEGFGLFRRFSIGTSRPKPPSPPPTLQTAQSVPAQPISQSLPSSTSVAAPVAADKEGNTRSARSGRGPFAGAGSKPKRRLSPMGERMLRGGAFD